MIRLTEIARNNGYITCVAYIEDSITGVDLSFDESKEEFGNYNMPEGYEWCVSHINHVKKYFSSLIGKRIEVTDKTIMWY